MRTAVVTLAILCLPCLDLFGEMQSHALPHHRASADTSLALLRESTQDAFRRTVTNYDRYIQFHPSDVVARIEECMFIEEAIDGGLVPLDVMGLIEQRIAKIRSRFANDPKAAVFLSTRMKSDSALEFLEIFLQRRKDTLRCADAWQLYAHIAQLYADEEQPYKAIQFAAGAMRCNDTLDLTALIGEEAEKVGDTTTALAYIARYERRDAPVWILRRKAALLLRLSQFGGAEAMFARILKREESGSTYYNIGQALTGSGRYVEARDAFIKSEIVPEYAESSARAVFEIDLRTANADSAVQSYNAMRDLGFKTDPLGKYRLALFLRQPFAAWRWRDVLNLGALLLCLLVLALLPAAVIVPVHYVSLLRNGPHPSFDRWTLKHVWFACVVLMFGTFMVWFSYHYTSVVKLVGGRIIEPAGTSTPDLAWASMMYFAIIALGSLAMVRRRDLPALWGSRWSKARSILSGLGTMLAVRLVAGAIVVVLATVFHVESIGNEFFKPLAGEVAENLRAIRDVFGWPWLLLVTVVAAPLCEEMLFRGVFLRGLQPHLPFVWANVIQAVAFAFVHTGDASMILAFILGVVAGLLRTRAHSLMPSIIMHVSNNLVSICVFMAMG